MIATLILVILIDISLSSSPAQRQKQISLFCANWCLICYKIIFFFLMISTLDLYSSSLPSRLHVAFVLWYISVIISYYLSFKLLCYASFSYFMTCLYLPPTFTSVLYSYFLLHPDHIHCQKIALCSPKSPEFNSSIFLIFTVVVFPSLTANQVYY